MKKIITFSLCAVLVTVCFSGCFVVNFTDFNAVTGKGDLEKYEINVGEYSGVKTEGFLKIYYHAASSNTVTLEVQPNLMEYFTLEVKNGDLVIRTTKRISVNSEEKIPVLTVSTPALKRLSISGACEFTTYDIIRADSFSLEISGAGKGKAELDVDRLLVDLSGRGDFDLSGKANNADIDMSGAGKLNALPLQTQTARLELSGRGDISISCAQNLSVDASGAGSVKYRGSPALNIDRSGAVSIKKVD